MNDEIKRCLQVLELEVTASAKEAKQARNEMAKVWHPDRFPNDPKLQQKGQEKLKEINAAYSVLNDYFSNPSNQEQKNQPKASQSDTRTRPSPPPTSKPDSHQNSQIKSLELSVRNDIQKLLVQNPITRSTRILTFSLTPVTANLFKGLLIAVPDSWRPEAFGLHFGYWCQGSIVREWRCSECSSSHGLSV